MINSNSYSDYMISKPTTNWTSTNELKSKLTKININNKSSIPAGGMPIISDGNVAYVDTSDNHCVIYGASGFKKSTCVFMPLIGVLAKANENMVILDPKGELYTRTSSFLRDKNYNIRVLNFRDFNGDGYNPLNYPASLWRSDNKDKALSVSNDFCSSLSSFFQTNSGDPFWDETAKAYMNGVLPIMYENYSNIEDINILSLSSYFTVDSLQTLYKYINNGNVSDTVAMNIKTVLTEPERTLRCTLATCSSYIQSFIQNERLIKMLSNSTFDLKELADKKTAIYIITDDTTNTCNNIVGTLISQIQSILVDKAFHSKDGRLKRRVNFILDEFCSIPVQRMTEALATHRSRNIRYFLCVQSLNALNEKYPYYESLLTNCATSLFLGSTELQLLDMISIRCGLTDKTHSGQNKPLISIPELMTLKKDWNYKEALYFNLAEAIRYCTKLPAIEQYQKFNSTDKPKLPVIEHPDVSMRTIKDLYNK